MQCSALLARSVLFVLFVIGFVSAGESTVSRGSALTDTILEHADELNLSAQQKIDLAAAQVMREKIESDAEIRRLFAELREASNAADDTKIGGIVEKISARKVELGVEKDPQGTDGNPHSGTAPKNGCNSFAQRRRPPKRPSQKREEEKKDAKGEFPVVEVKPNNGE